MQKWRWLAILMATFVALLFSQMAVFAEEDAEEDAEPELPSSSECMACHGEADIEAVSPRGRTLNLVVKKDALAGTAHEGMDCTDCHGGAQDFWDTPHNAGKPLSFKCDDCHDGIAEHYNDSVHGKAHETGDVQAAICADCHGRHQILPASNPKSSTNPFNLPKTCGTCHQGGPMLKTHRIGQPEAVGHFIDSIHGRALLINGLSVAPSCNDCHGVHDIRPHEDPKSKISPRNVPKTCGACHVLVEDTYNKSIHGQLYLAGKDSGPNCVTCHSAHEIDTPQNPVFRLGIDHKCGACHKDRLDRYRETFHGKAIALGRDNVAACSDCHGHHDILPRSNPASHISDQNRLQTCKRCHENANPNFANYIVHADHTDPNDNPVLYWVSFLMTALLLGTFAFFALHSLLWLVRSAALYLRNPKNFREQKMKVRSDDEEYVRFSPIDRFVHALIIFSFLLLVLTGMPLKFYYTDWAKWILALFGGQAVASVLHRLGAFITIFYFTVHVLTVSSQIWLHRRRLFMDKEKNRYTLRSVFGAIFGPDSPMPNLQDVRDFVAHQKWFFGRGPKPQFDRWTYWEKFDYFAVFWGVAVIGLSGLIMWIPTVFTIALPGWIINVAMVIHSDEALLASGFIFTFHFFNVHFRPEKFPMDPVIFSGRISKSELMHERRRLFERWSKSGELEEHRVKDEWKSWRWIALPAGAIAFLIGVALVIGIYTAMYERLMYGG